MVKLKKIVKHRFFPIFIILFVFIVILSALAPFVYDTLSYKHVFYISYHQYPGATPNYRTFSPTMEHATPSKYNGLEFIGWYYIDENGNEKEFIPSEFTPPHDPEINALSVYGRWRSVKPTEQQ